MSGCANEGVRSIGDSFVAWNDVSDLSPYLRPAMVSSWVTRCLNVPTMIGLARAFPLSDVLLWIHFLQHPLWERLVYPLPISETFASQHILTSTEETFVWVLL
jgi:hypothetical protein